jgi:hypothetical protein
MYWTAEAKIQRANLDGTQVEDLVTRGRPYGIALDVAGGKMYWANYVGQKIQRANLDGSGVENVVTRLLYPGVIALDLVVGGLANGFQPRSVACRNVTTGQRVKILPQPGPQPWDCQGAGLGVSPGDVLGMTARGKATGLPIGGSAINFEPSKVICRNVTTGRRVTIMLPSGADSWDCVAAGLVVTPGDVMRITVRGTEP